MHEDRMSAETVVLERPWTLRGEAAARAIAVEMVPARVPAAELVSVVTMPPKRKRKVSAWTVARWRQGASAPPSHDESRATEVRAIESAEDEAPALQNSQPTAVGDGLWMHVYLQEQAPSGAGLERGVPYGMIFHSEKDCC